MIYCQNCGTANSKGSRYCNECGAALPHTGRLCPMCSTVNPISNVYCENCNARLVPMSASPKEEEAVEKPKPIKGISLPTIPLEEGKAPRDVEESQSEGAADDWLAQLRSTTEDDSASAEGAEEYPEPAEPSERLEREEPRPESDELPDWLSDLRLPAEEPSVPKDEPAPEEEPLPAEPSPAPPEPTPAEPAPEPGEVPDWLRELTPSEVEAAEEPLPAEPSPAPPEPTPAERAEPALEPGEIPDWLREGAPSAEETPVVPIGPEDARDASPFAEVPRPEEAEFPEWLADLGEEPAPPHEDVAEAEPVEGLARAEIPTWLASLKPSTAEEGEDITAQEPPEAEGLLKGLRGLIQPASVIEAPSGYAGMPSSEPSEAILTRAKLLQGLLSQPTERPQPSPQERKVNIGELVQRWLVALVLLLAVGGGLMASYLPFTLPNLTRPAASSDAIGRMHDTIQDTSSAEDSVLVAFEYGPAEADELDLVARPILEQILDQKAHVSIASTQPEGLAVAARLMDEIIASSEQYTDTQYTILDYRAGGGTAISQRLTDIDPQPKLLFVLTARHHLLRQWIEQAQALYGDAIPIVAGVSAALEPAASPYLDVSAGQLVGAVHGLSGAAAYEEHRGFEGEATRRLDALAAGQIAIVGLMMLGAVLYGITGSRRRGR